MLLPRVLTAIVGIPLVVGAIHLGGLPYMAFVALVVALCLYEYGLILLTGGRKISFAPLFVFGFIAAFASVFCSFPAGANQPNNLLALSINVVVLGAVCWELFSPRRSLERLALTLLGVFFIPWTLSQLVGLREIKPHGEYLTLSLFITVWIADTAAYFVGKAWGKLKLLEAVSPKKTWEGAAAGFFAALAVSVFMRELFMPADMSFVQALALGAAAGIAGQVSDLAESMIKRSSGVKDSSSLLPGHGGVLDRFDSYLLLAPVYYWTALLIGLNK